MSKEDLRVEGKGFKEFTLKGTPNQRKKVNIVMVSDMQALIRAEEGVVPPLVGLHRFTRLNDTLLNTFVLMFLLKTTTL